MSDGDQTEGSGATSVDAQFTNVQVLKPFAGFEAVYQGKPASTPIAIPGDRDPRAGQPGYDPNLIAAIPVPLGSRIVLWIPQTPQPVSGAAEYAYRVVWRYRNLNDYRNPGSVEIPRPPYHIPRQSPGAPDTTSGAPVPRVVIPASYRVIADEQPEMTNTNGRVNLRVEDAAIVTQNLIDVVRPFLPDGSLATIQQGILDPATNPVPAPVPLFLPFQFDAEGDEMLLFAVRATLTIESLPWDFTSPNGPDFPFSNIYGTGGGTHASFPDVGILMVTGTNP